MSSERKLSGSFAEWIFDTQTGVFTGKVNAVGGKDVSLEWPREAITEPLDVLSDLPRDVFT